MKLAAIYNVWDGEELLAGSINCIKDHVDCIIFVYQKVSNWGEHHDPSPEIKRIIASHTDAGSEWVQVEVHPELNPADTWSGFRNEIAKRDLGLKTALQNGCTHFLFMDCDEYYTDFGQAKADYIASGAAGSVCSIITYFRRSTWRCDAPDGYFVPFIHHLHANLVTGAHKYPFHVDPTRRVNEVDVVKIHHIMHHFSYVRADIERKVRNSSARNNIKNGTIMQDYYQLWPSADPTGFYIRDWDRKIVVVPDQFGINL